MRPVKTKTLSWRRFAWVSALLALATFVLPSEAFPPVGGGRRPGPQKPSTPSGPGPEKPRDIPSSSSGQFGKIVKYSPIGESKESTGGKENKEEEKLLGKLSFKPQGKNSKTIILQMTKDPEPVVEVPDAGNYKIELDQLPEVLAKGLYCEASWEAADPTQDKKASGKKNLVKLSLTTIEIVGSIVAIQNNVIVLKAKPKGDKPWPDAEESEPGNATPTRPGKNASRPQKVKPVLVHKFNLKIMDNVTRFTDSANQTLSIDDFQAGQSIEAKIIYGSKHDGIVVVLSTPNKKGGAERGGSDQQARGRGGSQP